MPLQATLFFCIFLPAFTYASLSAETVMLENDEERFIQSILDEKKRIKYNEVNKFSTTQSKKIIDATTKEEQNNTVETSDKNITTKTIQSVQISYDKPIVLKVSLSLHTLSVSQEGVELYNWSVATGNDAMPTPMGNFKPQFFKKQYYDEVDRKPYYHYAIFFQESHAITANESNCTLGENSSSVGGVKLQSKNAEILFDIVVNMGAGLTKIQIVP